MCELSWLAEDLLASQEGPSFMELVVNRIWTFRDNLLFSSSGYNSLPRENVNT
jgi:hypothetical protein